MNNAPFDCSSILVHERFALRKNYRT